MLKRTWQAFWDNRGVDKEGIMTEHNHGTTSNTDEVFRTFIGEKIK